MGVFVLYGRYLLIISSSMTGYFELECEFTRLNVLEKDESLEAIHS